MGPVRRMCFSEVDLPASVLLTDPGTQAGNGRCWWEGKTRAKGEAGQQDLLRGSAEYIQSGPMAFSEIALCQFAQRQQVSFCLQLLFLLTSSGYLALN